MERTAFKTKLSATLSPERNEESCEKSRRVVAIPVVVEPVIVPVPHVIVEIEVTNIEVVVRIAVCV